MRFPPTLIAPTLIAVVCLAACSRQSPEAPSAPTTAAPAASANAAAAAAVPAAKGEPRNVEVTNDLIDFAYSYPAEAGAIPSLKAMLDADLDKQKQALITGAKERKAEAAKEGFDFHPFGTWIGWKVVTDLPGWLSLSADVGNDQGGAHPNHGFDALVWDRQANQRRAATDLFTSKAALSRAIRRTFCAELNKQRADRRGGPVKSGSSDEFDKCIDPVDSTVILGSSNRRTFDRIGVLVAPYEAGPYVEGDYEVTLPVTPAVLAVVKPEYRESFSAR